MVVCPVCRASYPEGTSKCPKEGSELLPAEAFAAADAPIGPGTMIGEYRVERKLGEGSFGTVYAGVQPLIGKRVAIKVLHKRMSSEPEVVARFIGEARAVNRIGHRNIIDVFSFGVYAESQHYFVMELCDGLTLAELLEKEKRLSLAAALPILRGIADGLDAAHAASVTHRDLKPDNVFLVKQKDGGYWPKLLDFGVAKLVSDEHAQKTATGVAIGTPRYMSPEQSRGKKVDHRSDVYSLGVLVHEMLTGKHLFEADSTVDLLFKHATEAPPSMSSVCPDIPTELDAPVLAMLAKRPAARPSSAGEAIAALSAKAGEIGGSATAMVQTPAEWSRSDELEEGKEEEKASAPEAPSAVAAVSVQEKPADEAVKTKESAGVASGTGTAEMAVSASGTILGEPLPSTLVKEGPAPVIPASGESARRAKKEVPHRRGLWTGIVTAVLGALSLSLLLSKKNQSEDMATAPPHAVVTAAPSSAEPSSVTIRFVVTPADARIFVDGKDMGTASEPLVLPRGKTERGLRFERSGYMAQMLLLRPEEDRTIGPITLIPAPASEAPSTSPAKTNGPQGTTNTTKQTRPINSALLRPDEFN